ncbi:MAG TPA: hypothetical protein VIJ75_17230, partial [Hanamia sp.]
GYGWAGGHYIPVESSIVAYLFQFIVIALLIVMGTHFLNNQGNETGKSNWSTKGLTIFSILSLLINIVNIIHGVYNPNSNSFGSHNSLADLVPIIIIITGTVLWLLTFAKKKALK